MLSAGSAWTARSLSISSNGCTPSAAWPPSGRARSGMIEATCAAPSVTSSWRRILPVSGSIHSTRWPPWSCASTSSSVGCAEPTGSSCTDTRPHASPSVPGAPKYFCQTISDVVASSANSFMDCVAAMMSLSAPKSRRASLFSGRRVFGINRISRWLRRRFGVTRRPKAAMISAGSFTSSTRCPGSDVSCAPSACKPPASSSGRASRSATVAAAERL
mmetsp:Transcript_52570/g.159817  ORF Transcript_52570/g.159817 Transcript_52570/m.159817 type:complete len:217 (+) Transcript_52570:1154-1804(+)